MGTTISDGGFTFESSGGDESAMRAAVTDQAAEKPATEQEAPAEAPKPDKPRDSSGKFAPKAAEPATEAEPPAEGDEKPTGKPRHDPKARMLQATQQAAEAKRERDAAKAELAAARAELEKIRARSEQARSADKEPTEDAFDNYSDYVTARARWAARQEYEERQVRSAQERHNEAQDKDRESRLRAFSEKLNGYIAEDPKFLDSLSPTVVNMTPISALPPGAKVTQANAVAEAILHSDDPRGLMRHLSENADELQRLTTLPMTQYQLTHAIARIEAKLEAAVTAGAAPKVEVSNAKPPVRPVTGSPHTADGVPDDAPFEEHYRAMNARERAERR